LPATAQTTWDKPEGAHIIAAAANDDGGGGAPPATAEAASPDDGLSRLSLASGWSESDAVSSSRRSRSSSRLSNASSIDEMPPEFASPPPPPGRVSPAAVQAAAKVHVLTEDGRDGWVAEATEQVL